MSHARSPQARARRLKKLALDLAREADDLLLQVEGLPTTTTAAPVPEPELEAEQAARNEDPIAAALRALIREALVESEAARFRYVLSRRRSCAEQELNEAHGDAHRILDVLESALVYYVKDAHDPIVDLSDPHGTPGHPTCWRMTNLKRVWAREFCRRVGRDPSLIPADVGPPSPAEVEQQEARTREWRRRFYAEEDVAVHDPARGEP